MEYLIHIPILTGIYIMLGVSLNLIVGYTGLLSLAQAAFYGTGAYCAALVCLHTSASLTLNLIIVVAVAVVFGLIVGIPTLRLEDEYFVIASFALQEITYSLLNNWIPVTGGPSGLPGIPRPVLFGRVISSDSSFLALVTILCMMTLLVSRIIVTSPFGRVLKSLREDQVLSLSFGKNANGFKVRIFLFGGCIAAVSGALYAFYISFIDPSSFTMMESVFIISIVIIGGTASLAGSCFGAVLLVLFPEFLRFTLGFSGIGAANIRQIFYGALLVAFMIWRPQGVLGNYSLHRTGL